VIFQVKKTFVTNSEEETFDLAAGLGRNARAGDVFALTGRLGAGKTIFAKGMAAGMGIIGDITSPTFNLMNTYEGEIPLYHFDLYRIEEKELDGLFFEEYWEDDAVSVIEWADRALSRLPSGSITVTMEYTGANTRRITIEYPDN
jgi:tRNA threonylcarbamoyladenosine biosynthesis protein TsaE